MCAPAALLAVSLIGTAVAGYAAYDAGQNAKEQGKINARLADEQSADTRKRGQIEEDRRRDVTRQQIAAQNSVLGANNVVSSTGTPLGLLAETAEYGELDALTLRNNAARESYGYKVEAFNSRSRGRQAAKQGTLNAGSTLLTGGAQAYGTYKKAG